MKIVKTGLVDMKTHNLTRNEAAEALSQGYKVAHNYFSDKEYLELKKSTIVTEDGYSFTHQFWTIDHFSDGWKIVE